MPYQTGLCSCTSDMTSCLDIICCAPCQIGRQCSALDGMVNEANCCHCMIVMFTSAYPIYACCIRMKVDEKYNLMEGGFMSCVFGCICPACSLCQTHRELTLQNAWPGGACCQKQPMSAPMS